MYKYEEVIIIKPTNDEEKINEVVDKFKNIMQEFSDKEIEINKIGLRRLAYEVRKNQEGYFVQYFFWGNPQNIQDLERNLRITDDVLKFMTVRDEEEIPDDSEEVR